MTEHCVSRADENSLSKEELFEIEHKVEFEDSDSNQELHPWDPEKIRITTKHFTLREVVEQIIDADIDLSPDFQREYVWVEKQKTRLIESILLGIPLPAFYFNQDMDGKYQIVDGVQRLSTIAAFMKGEHTLHATHLEYLKSYDGLKFNNLGTLEIRRFKSTQIVVHVIEPTTPTGIKYDIFSRVNTLGSPLKPQEIRHAMSTSRSREFLNHFIKNPYFDKATDYNFWKKSESGELIRNSGRMTDREIALRFCAFRISTLDEYRKFSSLDNFLINFTERLDGKGEYDPISDSEMADLFVAFENSMELAFHVLGENAFRRIEDGKRRGPINRAIFESQSIALSFFPKEQIMEHSQEIRTALINLFQDTEYTKSVTVGTGAPNSVKTRLQKPIMTIMDILKS